MAQFKSGKKWSKSGKKNVMTQSAVRFLIFLLIFLYFVNFNLSPRYWLMVRFS